MSRRKAKPSENISVWKRGINNVKNINVNNGYTMNMRGGIRF